MEGDVVEERSEWREGSFINSYQGLRVLTLYAAAMLVS